MMGWAAYAELEHEDYKKQQEQAQRSSALKGRRRQNRDNFRFLTEKWLLNKELICY